MCAHDQHDAPRTGARLADGRAHVLDHEAWTRRQFVAALGLGGVGSLLGGAIPVRAVLGAPALHPLSAADGDRILVLVQLEGGNDGLNTIIPVDDDRYYGRRNALAIARNEALDVGQEFRMHAALEPLVPSFMEGRVQVIHGVGYENPDLSHFRSTDIWVSASDASRTLNSGWIGRTVEENWPHVITDPPSRPLAVQIGGAAMMFRGSQTTVGASFRTTDQLERLADGGVSYDVSAVPDTRYGRLMAYTRDIANQSYRYAASLQEAAATGSNAVAYPAGELADQLAIVARLIKGGLGSRVYHVSLKGFDTHSAQNEAHPQLLAQLAGATSAFMADLEDGGREQDALIMTFSEFGRTVAENGSGGTDHGTVAPLFLMGHGLSRPVLGVMPDLDVVNEFGDLEHIIDFRRIYASVLEKWLRIPPHLVDAGLGESYERLDLFASHVAVEPDTLPAEVALGQPFPNPASSWVAIPASDALEGGTVELFDATGRAVRSVALSLEGGAVRLWVADLPSGRYFARFGHRGVHATRSIVVVR